MGAEAVVLSFLYSLLMSMGLIGGSYQDIANAFPDNTTAQNSILYSVANNPTLSTPYNTTWTDVNGVHAYEVGNFITGSAYLKENFDALMTDLGFAIVDNNVDVAIDNGYSVTGVQWVGTMSNGVDTAIVSYVGTAQSSFRTYDNIPDNVGFNAGFGGVHYGRAVWRWSYGDTIIYSTSQGTGLGTYVGLSSSYVNPHFEVTSSGTLQFVYDYLSHSDGWQKVYIPFSIQDWINQGIAIDDAATFEPTESVAAGEEYLSFGDADNPVISVEYDPATGVTTYKYKDGTISTNPPAVLGDGVTLSPSITQPLTNYIINEGDITNIYNPDAAIPSDSSVPFDFTALGDTIVSVFKPSVDPNPEPMFNRFKNKFDPQAYWDKMVKKWNVQPHRPSYPVTINWLGKSVTFDFWDWCDVLLNQQNYMLYRFFVRFFIYCGYVLLIGQLLLGLFNIRLTPHVEDSTILGFRG